MEAYARHVRVFRTAGWLARRLICPLLNYSYDDFGHVEGPYLLLANHNLDVDPILVGIAARRHMYFVASEHILHKGIISRLLMYLCQPIIHTKGQAGLHSTIEILRKLKEGHSVGLFPEGNRSFTGETGEIAPVIGKLAKRSGAALVTFRVEGGYFTQPRWGRGLRRGRLRGRLMHVYSPETLKVMTNEEVNAAILQDLHEDAYATQARERVAFRGKHTAEGLESTLFACPACTQIGTLQSRNDTIRCGCGWQARYTREGYLQQPDGSLHTITELDAAQRARLREAVEAGPADRLLFSDSVKLQHYDGNHQIDRESAVTVSAACGGFLLDGRPVDTADIRGAAIYSRNVLVLHMGKALDHYELRGDTAFSALKYLYLYHLLKGKKED